MCCTMYKKDLHYIIKKNNAMQLCQHLLQDITFSLHILLDHLHLDGLKQFPWANCPEYNERSTNVQPCQQPCYSFTRIPLMMWVVSLEMNRNWSFFWIVFFLNENPNDVDFLSDLELNFKKCTLKGQYGYSFLFFKS